MFEGFTYVSENLDRKKFFEMLNGDKILAKSTLSWKHRFDSGANIPQKQG